VTAAFERIPDGERWRWRRSLEDIVDGICDWQVWATLAYEDIRQRYVRSVLGEFWLTLSMGVTIVTIGVIYSGLFRHPMQEYLPYLAAGVAGWALISSVLNEGAHAFIADYQLILQTNRPKTTYLLRVLARGFFVYLHNAVVVIAVCAFFGQFPSLAFLLIVPNLALILLNLAWMIGILSVLSARFRDIPPILASVLQIVFFATPIIWNEKQLPPDMHFVVTLNPFAALMELMRAPYLGQVVPITHYAAVIAMAALGSAAWMIVYSRARHRVPFWL
jgi:ABC-type polysaccharide/polyol phosphate export permease